MNTSTKIAIAAGVVAAVVGGGAAVVYMEWKKKEDAKKNDAAKPATKYGGRLPVAIVPVVGRPHSDPFYSASYGVWGSGPWAHRVPRTMNHHPRPVRR